MSIVYYCGENLKYYLTPSPQISLLGGRRWEPIRRIFYTYILRAYIVAFLLLAHLKLSFRKKFSKNETKKVYGYTI
jgi:hypothetical protein